MVGGTACPPLAGTHYELISQLIDDILAHVDEFKYKWGFLSEFNKLNI